MNEKRCRDLVYERSGGLCERCGKQGNTYHHRKNRSAGGEWDCANIVFLCGDGTRGCHGWVTTHPLEASIEGFHVKPWQHPEDLPILLHRRLTCGLSCNDSSYTSDATPQPRSHRETQNIEWTTPDHSDWPLDR